MFYWHPIGFICPKCAADMEIVQFFVHTTGIQLIGVCPKCTDSDGDQLGGMSTFTWEEMKNFASKADQKTNWENRRIAYWEKQMDDFFKQGGLT